MVVLTLLAVIVISYVYDPSVYPGTAAGIPPHIFGILIASIGLCVIGHVVWRPNTGSSAAVPEADVSEPHRGLLELLYHYFFMIYTVPHRTTEGLRVFVSAFAPYVLWYAAHFFVSEIDATLYFNALNLSSSAAFLVGYVQDKQLAWRKSEINAVPLVATIISS